MVLIGRMRYKLFLLRKGEEREKFLKWLLFFPQLEKSALQKSFKYLHQKNTYGVVSSAPLLIKEGVLILRRVSYLVSLLI